jgi:acyl-CoA synthetase (AMP-forming)/AMP-acid ligase II
MNERNYAEKEITLTKHRVFSVESMGRIILTMDLFTQLRQHARTQPETVATASRQRDMTYRKLWSRVERATARLQAEWGVARGDRVVYSGPAHPDAIVLYVALARCGARLVAVEDPAWQPQAGLIMRELGAQLLLHEDGHPPQRLPAVVRIKPLSSLIDSRCPHQPFYIDEQARQPSLITVHGGAGMQTIAYSLDQLIARIPAAVQQDACVTGRLFDEAVFAPVVLPALLSGRTLLFR